MKPTRKHFEELASVLKYHRALAATGRYPAVALIDSITDAFGVIYAKTNPNFDLSTWEVATNREGAADATHTLD